MRLQFLALLSTFGTSLLSLAEARQSDAIQAREIEELLDIIYAREVLEEMLLERGNENKCCFTCGKFWGVLEGNKYCSFLLQKHCNDPRLPDKMKTDSNHPSALDISQFSAFALASSTRFPSQHPPA
ncbi:hypothetical protein D9611_013132 [Ephemerocybe angulata]|uniref:Uncharacterized protein n=1 Tax=Ephemerocybe angulata TaxID=980116 RepID=A0A8H5BZ77_9AGAR|nr:hypothetical protein D9611_013132 [Tulosesus angulatus]